MCINLGALPQQQGDLTELSHPRPPLRWPINPLAWGRIAGASVFPRRDPRSTGYGARISNEFRADCGG
jgi:hypothetical protein